MQGWESLLELIHKHLQRGYPSPFIRCICFPGFKEAPVTAATTPACGCNEAETWTQTKIIIIRGEREGKGSLVIKWTKPENLSCIAEEKRRRGIDVMIIFSSLTFLDKEIAIEN